MSIPLALFEKRLKQNLAALMTECGAPDHLTRHAIGRDEKKDIEFDFSVTTGPKRDDKAELIDLVILGKDEKRPMLVTMQFGAKATGEITDDEMSAIGTGLYGYYEDTGTVVFAAKADPELDGKTAIAFFDKADDKDDYAVFDVSGKIDGYAVDVDKAVVYFGDQVALLPMAKLLENLRDDGKAIDDGAVVTKTFGSGAKMARPCVITIGDDKKQVWSCVTRGADGKSVITFLDKDSLDPIAMTEFEGNYATASYDGAHVIFVGHQVNEELDGGEVFPVTRRPMIGLPLTRIGVDEPGFPTP